HPGTVAKSNDFYFVLHFGSLGNPLEQDETGNDALATAEVLQPYAGNPKATYVEGDLINGATDVDYFSVAVPSGGTQVYASCSAKQNGSGLVGLTTTLLSASGATLAQATEQGGNYATTSAAAVPGGATKTILKVSASSQD